jgi:hypothetical protein
MTPRAVIEAIECDNVMSAEPGDVFSGWGVLGVPFQSGHVLALRRYVVSSLGPAYTSIWHRDPAGRWTFYSTIAPDCSCARYYGARIDRNVVAPIDLEWTTPWTLHARVGRTLTWHVTLYSSSMSRLFNTVTLRLPARAWRVPVVLRSVGLAADAAFGSGRIQRSGRTPNGHRFALHPRQFWLIDASAAHVGGNDLGPPGPLAAQATLEDMRLPQRGLLAVTSVRFERPAGGTGNATRYGTPCNAKPSRSGHSHSAQLEAAVRRVTRGIR